MRISSKDLVVMEKYLQLAHKVGFSNLTLQNIAKATGISYGKAHFYFGGDRETFYLGVLEYVGEQAQKFAESFGKENSSEISPMTRYIDATFAWTKEKPHHASFWLYYYYLCTIKGHLRRKNPKYLSHARLRIENLIRLEREGKKKHSQDLAADIRQCAIAIHSVIVGFLILSHTDNQEGAFENYRSLTHKTARGLLNAM